MEDLMTGSAQLLVTVANLLTLCFVIYVFYLLLLLVRQFMRPGGSLDLKGLLVLAFLLMVVPIFLRRYPAIVIQAGADGLTNSREPASQLQVQLVDWAMDSITPLAGMAPPANATPFIQGATLDMVAAPPTATPTPAVTIIVVTATPTATPEQQVIIVTATPTAPSLGEGQNAIIEVATPTVASPTVASPTAEPTFDPAIWNAQTPPPTPGQP